MREAAIQVLDKTIIRHDSLFVRKVTCRNVTHMSGQSKFEGENHVGISGK